MSQHPGIRETQQKELVEAFAAYDLCSRVSTLAKARAEAAYKACSLAALEAFTAHKAEIAAADKIYNIARPMKWTHGE
jgi:hypothetical protein